MKLEISIQEQEIVFQESVPVRIVFINGERPTEFPYEPSSLNITTFRLFDAKGNLISEGDGYSCDVRLGLEASPEDPASLVTATLSPGQTVEWDEDLLGYVDIPGPGDYEIQVRFAFPPSGVEAESAMCSLRVRPICCRYLDVVTDDVAMAVLHLAQQHEADRQRRTIFHFRSVHAPGQRWSGMSFPSTPPTPVRISEADFTTQETFEHDFSRWLVWFSDNMLTLRSIREEEAAPVQVHQVELDQGRLAGRPVQHEDGGLTVFVAGLSSGTEHPDKAYQLHRFDFDPEGMRIGTQCLDPHFPPDLSPLCSACDHDGRSLILAAVDGKPPFWLWSIPGDSSKVNRIALPGPFDQRGDLRDQRVFCTRVVLKRPQPDQPTRICAAGVLEDEHGQKVWTAWAELNEALSAKPEWRISEWILKTDMLKQGEVLLSADVVPAPDGVLHGIFSTSKGRVLHLRNGETPSLLALEGDAVAGQVRLAVVGGEVVLFFVDESFGARHLSLPPRARF